jgi:HAD superfamily hydrolase (TIGR01549 family)
MNIASLGVEMGNPGSMEARRLLKAVLFDLDNTLIRFDEREFFEAYIPRISKVFSDMMSPEMLLERLLLSTLMLVNNNGQMSNAEYFMSFFSQGYEEYREEIWKRFIKFHETEFDEFQPLVSVIPGVHEVFMRLREKGVKLVIASNPIWPQIVQIKLLSWAGLGDWNFELVTHIENMSYCKPHIEYYLEVCKKINEKPEGCLMVGDDPVNDLIVGKTGMKTFLVTNGPEFDGSEHELSKSIRDDTASELIAPDFQGLLSDVPGAVEALLKG